MKILKITFKICIIIYYILKPVKVNINKLFKIYFQ